MWGKLYETVSKNIVPPKCHSERSEESCIFKCLDTSLTLRVTEKIRVLRQFLYFRPPFLGEHKVRPYGKNINLIAELVGNAAQKRHKHGANWGLKEMAGSARPKLFLIALVPIARQYLYFPCVIWGAVRPLNGTGWKPALPMFCWASEAPGPAFFTENRKQTTWCKRP